MLLPFFYIISLHLQSLSLPQKKRPGFLRAASSIIILHSALIILHSAFILTPPESPES